jgi:type I restriction enzyme S subunit
MTAATIAPPMQTPKAFAVWFKDLERWSVGSFTALDWRWPRKTIRPLAEALWRKSADVDRKTTDTDALKLITLHFDGEIEPRQQRGTKPIKGRLWWADPGNVVYSKIDVRNGAIGIVPEDLGRVCVTSEYPVYAVDPGVTDAGYIKLLFRTATFRRKINAMISGASGRKRVQPSDLEAVDVPLPPLSVQRAIVSAWEQAQAEVADTRRRIAELEDKIEADFLADLGLTKPQRAKLPKVFAVRWHELERWSVMFNQLATVNVDISSGKHPVSTLGDVAAVSYGIQKCPANRPGQHARPYLRVANVQRGELDLREVKTINVPDAEMPTYRLEAGDLLFVEGNGSRAELGRCALWHGEIEDCVHQNHILKVRPDGERLLSDFAMTWFNTDAGKDHFFRSVKTSSGLGSINSTELRAAPIPLPPLPVQRQLVAKVAAQRKKIAAMKADAQQKTEQAKAEVEAMILGERKVKA